MKKHAILKKLAALVLALALLPLFPARPARAAALPFEDVAEGAWYYADVERAYGSGLFKGVSDTRFDPAGKLLLSQAVTLAARVAQTLAEGRATLENGSPVWYSTFVDYAKEKGIIGAEYDGRWNEPASRAEMVAIFAAIPGVDLSPLNDVREYAIPDVGEYDESSEAVYTFYRAGILTGDENHLFNGHTDIARREVAAILSRLLYRDRRQTVELWRTETPDLDDELSGEALLALLDRYDPDGAWILRHGQNANHSWRDYVAGDRTFNEARSRLELVVHESLHVFNRETGKTYSRAPASHDDRIQYNRRFHIYIGGGAFITVPLTNVYDTAEMAETIPETLRTVRYDEYVSSEAHPLVGARSDGVYGLLDEFAAYCWGMNDETKLIPFRQERIAVIRTNYVTYVEFRYYILSYLLYAREHYPDIYEEIMDNAAFCRAFTTIDGLFAGFVQDYLAAKRNPTPSADYRALEEACSAPEYQELLGLLNR